MKPQDALLRVIEHREIFHDEMISLMRQIMQGEISPVMTAAILTGLRVKKETVGEITAAAQVMRELSTRIEVADNSRFVDIVGTGGDGAHTFNISTAAMFVAAAAGAKVAKHGNRSVSSSSGSADVLESLGANIMLTPAQVGECLAATGIGFMFAPNHHSAMKNVAPVRREMGVRTILIFSARSPTRPVRRTRCSACFTQTLLAFSCASWSASARSTCWLCMARTVWTKSRSAQRRWLAS